MYDAVTVMVVDDHDLFRIGVRSAMEAWDNIEVIGEAACHLEAIEQCEILRPDVVLIDTNMQRTDCTDVIPALLESHPPTQVVVLTDVLEIAQVHAAVQAGAVGYLLKDVSPESLAAAIHETAQGKTAVSPEVAQLLIETVREPPPQYTLTPRELDVLAYLVRGLTNDEIALNLIVSPATVKKHVSNILMKFNARSRAEAVAIALKEKLIDAG